MTFTRVANPALPSIIENPENASDGGGSKELPTTIEDKSL
jgi:hypothetical protein